MKFIKLYTMSEWFVTRKFFLKWWLLIPFIFINREKFALESIFFTSQILKNWNEIFTMIWYALFLYNKSSFLNFWVEHFAKILAFCHVLPIYTYNYTVSKIELFTLKSLKPNFCWNLIWPVPLTFPLLRLRFPLACCFLSKIHTNLDLFFNQSEMTPWSSNSEVSDFSWRITYSLELNPNLIISFSRSST